MAILIMINNFFHDFTAALFVSSSLLLWFLRKEVKLHNKADVTAFYQTIFPALLKTIWGSLCTNLLLGVFRAINYYSYEYLPAAGKDQITALIVKHVLIFLGVGVGLIFQRNFWKEYRTLRRSISG